MQFFKNVMSKSVPPQRLRKLLQDRLDSRLIPWLWLAAGYLYDIWYHIFPGKWILDSDLASEMVLANKLNEEHSILSTDWFYSTELRVFHSQWFYRLGLLFFPDNWHRARILAAAMMLALFVFLLISFSKAIGLEKYGVWCAAFMMWPFGNWYLVYGIFGTYYLIYIFFSLSTLLILLKLPVQHLIDKGVKWKTKIKILLLCAAGSLISFASGLNGIKQLMIFFAPLSAALVLFIFFEIRDKDVSSLKELKTTCGRELGIFFTGLLFALCSAAGYMVNTTILSKKYVFRAYGDIMWATTPINRLYDVWFDFINLYGFRTNVKLMSLEGITAALGLMLGFSITISIIRLCVRYKSHSTGLKLTLLLTISTLLINGLIFCLADIDYKEYHWLPLLPFGALLLIAEIETERFSMKHIPRMFLKLIMISVTMCSFITVKKEQELPLLPIRLGYNQITDRLLELGLTEGYTAFWSSAVLREMSNGAIETWTVSKDSIIYEWLQEKNHLTRKPEKPYFFLYDNRLCGEKEWYPMICDGTGKVIYEDEYITIYIYE